MDVLNLSASYMITLGDAHNKKRSQKTLDEEWNLQEGIEKWHSVIKTTPLLTVHSCLYNTICCVY